MLRIDVTSSASNDLGEIWDYLAIEQQAPEAADLLIDEFDMNFQRLTQFPLIGEAVDHLRSNTRRIIVHRRYLVFYEADESRICILRVLHGAKLIQPSDLV